MTKALTIILDDFARFHDMERVKRDAHGVHTLVFDGRWVVNLESDPVSGTVCLFGSPGSIPAGSGRPMPGPDIDWQHLRFGDLPFEARVGVHESGIAIMDSRCDPAQLDTVQFRHWLMGFVAQMIEWSHRLHPTRHAPSPPGPATRLPSDRPTRLGRQV